MGGGLVEPVTLNLQSGHFTALDAPFRTLVGVIKANELVDLYNRAGVGNTLFHLNIRPLGSRRANPRIVETALSDDEAAHFFYYNNGVSAGLHRVHPGGQHGDRQALPNRGRRTDGHRACPCA